MSDNKTTITTNEDYNMKIVEWIGIRNNYPDMSEEDIDRYFEKCKRNR